MSAQRLDAGEEEKDPRAAAAPLLLEDNPAASVCDDKDKGSNRFVFCFFLAFMAVPWARIFVMLSSMSTSDRQIPNIISDIFRHFGKKDCLHTKRACGAQNLKPWWTPDCFFCCYSNMQNQANCLSVNIICDVSCTYTFYVLSDGVNGDSKQMLTRA